MDILHLSHHLIVVNKPSGLLSVAGRGAGKEDSLSRRVQAEYPDALIVHRLDMGTSGIVVMARGADAHRELSAMFEERLVSKRYRAMATYRVHILNLGAPPLHAEDPHPGFLSDTRRRSHFSAR